MYKVYHDDRRVLQEWKVDGGVYTVSMEHRNHKAVKMKQVIRGSDILYRTYFYHYSNHYPLDIVYISRQFSPKESYPSFHASKSFPVVILHYKPVVKSVVILHYKTYGQISCLQISSICEDQCYLFEAFQSTIIKIMNQDLLSIQTTFILLQGQQTWTSLSQVL